MKLKDLIIPAAGIALTVGLVVATNHTQQQNQTITPNTGSAGMGVEYQPGQQPW